MLSPGTAVAPVPTMRSALSSEVGAVPAGTVTVGGVPAAPAGERSAAGIGAMAMRAPPPGAVVEVADGPLPRACVVVVLVAPVEDDGDELQAARTNAPATTNVAATAQARECRWSMSRDGSRSLPPPGGRRPGRFTRANRCPRPTEYGPGRRPQRVIRYGSHAGGAVRRYSSISARTTAGASALPPSAVGASVGVSAETSAAAHELPPPAVVSASFSRR